MRGRFNDGVRSLIGVVIAWLGVACGTIHWIETATFFRRQERLRRRYRVTPQTPVLPYGPKTEKLIRDAAARYSVKASHAPRYAQTSGSTATPKRMLYTKRRLRSVRWTFTDVFVRCYSAYRLRRKSLYVFRAFGKSHSLTSMLLEAMRLPSYVVTLQAPYRVECHPAIHDLAARYGTAAVRLWILTISNPGVLYSTNPSTLLLFLQEIATDWPGSRRLIRDFRTEPGGFDPAIHTIARRLDSAGSTERIARIASAAEPLPLSFCAPAVRAYVCWTGGYVRPFLDRIAEHLSPDRYRLIPMYSMSTETIETISHFDGDAVAFLPLGRRVLYEFIEEGVPDNPENLRKPDELEPMKSYTMVVSDPYGLSRYQTEDVFLCNGFVGKLPDLHFLRRRNLEYSFTGEKLSSEQLDLVFERLREECRALSPDTFLTCIPSQPHDEHIPRYTIVLAGSNGNASVIGDSIAARCDALLQEVNVEYKDKRASGRLGTIRFVSLTLDEFIAHVSGCGDSTGRDGQFKFLPLYRRTWEEMVAPPAGQQN